MREGEQWILSEISDPASTLHLASVDCHVGLAAIYEKVDFDLLPKVQTHENDSQSLTTRFSQQP